LGNNVVGADCVEFKPVENPKVLDVAGSPASSGAWEEVTAVFLISFLPVFLLSPAKIL